MKLCGMLLAVLVATPVLAAASDPFVGTWTYNAAKSPKPTITYGIKDLGDGRYALTGSSGETTEVKADGAPVKSPSGATVSFRKLDDHTWQMDRTDERTMKRTYTVSADDRTLTLVDVFTAPNNGQQTTKVKYARTGPGRSLYGEWKSVSIEDHDSGPPGTLLIEPYGGDGLSLTSSDKHRTDMKFDGKQYFETAPEGTTKESSSGRRVSDRVIEMESQTDGTPGGKQEFTVSEDGKTLTIVNRPLRSSAVFTSVWDKQ